MLDFNHVLDVEGKGSLYLTFNCISTPLKKKFHVTVLTWNHRCYHFNMEENYGKWKMIAAPKPPGWIEQLEPMMKEMIQKHMMPEMQSMF